MLKTICTVIAAIASFLFTGCPQIPVSEPSAPTKPAGPGGDRQQPYSPNDGTYKPNNYNPRK